jgi:hypothetical protein
MCAKFPAHLGPIFFFVFRAYIGTLFYVATVASHTPSSLVTDKTWRKIRWLVRRNVCLKNERRISIAFFEYGEQNQVMYFEMQDEQCTYNLTLMRVHVSIFAVEKQYVLYVVSEYLYSCPIYLAWKKQAPYYVLIVRMYNIFPKNVIEHVACFSATLPETFLIPRIIQQYTIINLHRCSCQIPVIFQILMKLEFSRQIFEKY